MASTTNKRWCCDSMENEYHKEKCLLNPSEDKIQLKAWMDENSQLHIIDQFGREFDFVPEWESVRGRDVAQIKVDIEYPHWPLDKPHVEVTFRLPLEVKSKAMIEEFREYWEYRGI